MVLEFEGKFWNSVIYAEVGSSLVK